MNFARKVAHAHTHRMLNIWNNDGCISSVWEIPSQGIVYVCQIFTLYNLNISYCLWASISFSTNENNDTSQGCFEY